MLAWMQFGNFGRQLAVLEKTSSIRVAYVGHKWSASSHRWTGRVKVKHHQLVSELTPEEVKSAKVQRALSELFGQTGLKRRETLQERCCALASPCCC